MAGFALLVGSAGTRRSSEGQLPKEGDVKWIVFGDDLASLRESNAGVARRTFDNRNTIVLGNPLGEQDSVPSGYRSIPGLAYTSVAEFTNDVRLRRIGGRVRTVLYDPESWNRTPLNERRHPLSAMLHFNRLAHRWKYRSISSPARDLALTKGGACRKQEGELLDQAYLRCDFAGGAVGSDAFVIQAAPDELDLTAMERFLKRGAQAVRSHSAKVRSFATLSTSPPGADEPVWPIDLVRAARLEKTQGQGILFNFTPGTVSLAASFLRDLER